MTDSLFQIFECQNPDCGLRFPSNLTITNMESCPLCRGPLCAVGKPYANEKISHPIAHRSTRKLEILLDNLRSTLNVGSIFRTADGAGVSHIYCCGTTPTPDHPKILKTGLGAEGFVSWSYHHNAVSLVDSLLNERLVYSLEASETAISIFDGKKEPASDKPLVLIVGNEISGIDPELMNRSQRILSLPMMGTKTSLNVAVAAGIAIYALRFL